MSANSTWPTWNRLMFEQIVNPGSLNKPTPAENRELRIRFGLGTIVFGIGVLLQLAHSYGLVPAFAHARVLIGLLMLAGMTLQAWGLGKARLGEPGEPWKKH